MDKIANRAIRRVLQMVGKMVDNGASSGELRSVLRSGAKRKTHWDFSKPIWERHGFSSKDELLQSWRDSKAQALKEFPEPVPVQPGFGQRISDFIYRIRHGHRRLRPITEFTSPAAHIRQAYRYPVVTTHRGPITGVRELADTSADYTPVINDYLERVATNYKGRGVLGRFRDLVNRHDVLVAHGAGMQSVNPYKLLSKYVVNSYANNHRLMSKLDNRMLRSTGSTQMPDGFFDIFPFRGPSDGVSVFQMPVVTAFRAQGPFATTGHVMNGDITRGFSEKVNDAVNKLNESGTPVTHRNIKNMLAEDGVDYTRMTLHSGRVYPDKMADNYAHIFNADAKPTRDYESVFKAGDPNAPVPEQNYIVEIPDGNLRARQAEVINRSGLGHILKRPSVSLSDTQGTSDLRLFKGTPFPVYSIPHAAPGDPYIDNILENVLDSATLGDLRRGKDILYRPNVSNALNNTIGTKGAKYDDYTDFWYTPRVGSATGYAVNPHGLNVSPEAAKGIRLIPVTSSELDALHHVYDVKDILSKLPPDVLTDLPKLVSSYGGVRASRRLTDRMNRNVVQLKDAIKNMAEGKDINNGIGKAITRNSKFRDAGIVTDAEYVPDDDMFKEVLGYRW